MINRFNIKKMENEKLQINLALGMAKAEVILREGKAVERLPELAPLKTAIKGTIGAISEYLDKRLDTGQFEQENCHILVDREKITLALAINESDPYREGAVVAKLQKHPKFVEFGINEGKMWAPTELGLFLKMNRVFFPDKSVNMQLVTTLMNFTADINQKVQQSFKETGDRTDNFSQVVNSNLPKSFSIKLPLFKGMPEEVIEVETLAYVNGREVSFTLVSPGAQMLLEDIRDKVIDAQIKMIREMAPNIAIIEV